MGKFMISSDESLQKLYEDSHSFVFRKQKSYAVKQLQTFWICQEQVQPLQI